MRSRTSRILARQTITRAPRDAEPFTVAQHVGVIVLLALLAAAAVAVSRLGGGW